MTIKSPCIDICKIDEDTGYCLGCYRTKQEIKQWKAGDDNVKSKILKRLAQRKANDATL